MNEQLPQQRNLLERGIIFAAKATVVGSAILALTAIAAEVLDPTETELKYEGSGTLVHIGDQVSMPIVHDVGLYAGGSAKQDISLMPDSDANNRGEFLQNIEYFPEGLLHLEAFEDDQIGFYVLMSEFVDGQELREFDYSDIQLTTKQPVSCDFSLEVENENDNYIAPEENCVDVLNGEDLGWHGLEHSTFSKGGVFGTRLDNTPPTKARRMTDTILDNTWCQYGLRFGVNQNLFVWDQASMQYKIPRNPQFTEKDVYNGVKERIIALYRKIASDSTGLPLALQNGRPVFLTESQRDFLLRVANEHGPIKDLSRDEYMQIMQMELQLDPHADEDKDGAIKYGRPVAYDLIDLQKQYPDIVIDSLTTDDSWLEEGQEKNYILNYNCLPLTDEGTAEFAEEATMTSILASYTDIVPGAILVPDPSTETADQSVTRLYLNGGAQNYLANYVQQVLSTEEVAFQIITYKLSHSMDLTDTERAILEQQSSEVSDVQG